MATSACRNPADALRPFELQGVVDTGNIIGEGAYGTVKEVTFHGLKCVGKKIHALLCNLAPPQEKVAVLERFANECHLLNQLHHPCIVQCLGVYFEGGSDLPVLVMEYLHITLAECLEKGIPPGEIMYEILRDVILGLRYLHEHSPPIIHRDLSANNVLLTPNMSAKISDLGVAKILNLSPSRMSQIKPHTQMPGTPCYMPPEAMVAQPNYTHKVDIFSFGVMMVHMLSCKWPIPGEAFREDPNNPDLPIGVSEFDRRVEFLQHIPQDHPLMSLIRRCLSNVSSRRPEAAVIYEDISSILSGITPTYMYINRLEMLQQITSLREQVDTLSRKISYTSDQNESLRAQVARLHVEREETQSTGAGSVQGDRGDLNADMSNSLTEANGLPRMEFGGNWYIGCSREVFFLASIENISCGSPEPVHLQDESQLTEEDLQMLRSEGSPRNCPDDLSVVSARYALDTSSPLYREEVSIMEMDLSRDHVMEKLEQFLNCVEQPEAVIFYVGHGKKGTGDWCFKDGFITFRDILHLYNTTKIKGRVLTIISNCSYSGSWVKECCRYLDEQGVTSCGHSAFEKGILLTVFASCKPSEEANTLAFSTSSLTNEEDEIKWTYCKEIQQSQHAFGINFTELLCGKAPNDPCTRQSPEYAWMKQYQGLRGLLQLVRATIKGRSKWFYVVLKDEEEIIREYKQKLGGPLNVADYSLILKWGWEQDPPAEVKREMELVYGAPYTR